jgi:hypothetical protein
MTSRSLASLAFLTLLGGCAGTTSPTACTLEARPGIAVHVRDASTSEWAASGARLITTSSAGIADTTSLPAGRADLDSLALSDAYEQAGTFSVKVEKDGYEPWVRTDVRVTKDECHVRTATLTAALTTE